MTRASVDSKAHAETQTRLLHRLLIMIVVTLLRLFLQNPQISSFVSDVGKGDSSCSYWREASKRSVICRRAGWAIKSLGNAL